MTVFASSDPIPTVNEILSRAHVVSLPMRVKFRGISTREALLIDGPSGWGEFAPFLEYGPQESSAWLVSAIEAAWRGYPPPLRDKIEVNATIPAVPITEVAEILAAFPGCRSVKVKVAEPGHTLEMDRKRVEAVRLARPGARIRIDANGGWTVKQAITAARSFGPLDYLEQPCATVEELAEVRATLQKTGIFARVAADESIRKSEDPYRVLDFKAADVAVLKVAPSGGVRRLLEISQHLRNNAMDITVASALDTVVGISGGLAAVAALPHFVDDDHNDVSPAAAGLATSALFVEDLADPPRIIDGYVSTETIVPERGRLETFAASEQRRDWWFARVREAYPYLVV